jgi:hypothetical protein
MSSAEAPIVRVIMALVEGWEAPEDEPGWIKTMCPFHGDTRPSATVSYELNSFRCFACDARGDCITLIMRVEEVDYRTAERRATSILGESGIPVSPIFARKPGRRVFGDERPVVTESGGPDRAVQAGIRERSTPWS